MTLKVIRCQSLGEYVSNLVFCVDREDLDKSLTNMFAKVVVTNIYVLGPRMEVAGKLTFSKKVCNIGAFPKLFLCL
jgi:hypothetical protein